MNRLQELAFAGATVSASLIGAGCSGDNPTQSDLELRKCTFISEDQFNQAGYIGEPYYFLGLTEDLSDEYYNRISSGIAKPNYVVGPIVCSREIVTDDLMFTDDGQYIPMHVRVSGMVDRGELGPLELSEADCVVSALVGTINQDGEIVPGKYDGQAIVEAAC
jgi:hypothetical protein